MSLFRASFPGSGDFAPLFRLLDDYDTHRSTRSQPSARSFSPRFDDIEIEFSDPQTLVVKGHIERDYNTSNRQAQVEDEEAEQTGAEPTHRFWASERAIGEFQRTFSFPTRVDQDNVKANLKNGILSVQVPKATVSTTKKITIE
ncbi:uncharacterized protein N7446_007644 [Penicillium canescens]|uniref:uncharacterized protein n=1 Tax=Penicillium canescens TaxID=5083 RepID=UPI0026DEEF1D|nr:uncharacterized protein N7446_007644 [Penicillium canescens]KAJ6058061.1 hypothetical protein N7446_007644 [Penicillium canescens]